MVLMLQFMTLLVLIKIKKKLLIDILIIVYLLLKCLENTIEDVREVMDYLSYSWKGIPEALEELMIELNDMEEVQNGTDQG